MTLLFWTLVAVIAYAYVGYPVLVAGAAKWMDRRVRRDTVEPTVSVIVAAFDEANGISERISNLLDSDYPSDRLEVVIASDGSTDETVQLARTFDPHRVTVLDLPRRGKAAALAEGARRARGHVLVFTDANTVFKPYAIKMLARNFADPGVGGVAGRTGYRVSEEAESTGLGEDLYWRYDTWLKALESRTGSVVSAHGGMYAVRRELFRPVEDPAVTDDFAISTAVVAQGKRLVFEPRAYGYEQTMAESGSEFRRRVRLMTRGLRGVILRRRLLNPFEHGFYAVALFSRKVLRRLVPLAFVPLVVVATLLAPTGPHYAVVAAGMVSFAAAAAVGGLLRSTEVGSWPVFYVPFFFCLANLASLMAIANILRGTRIERWTPQRHGATGSKLGSPATGLGEVS